MNELEELRAYLQSRSYQPCDPVTLYQRFCEDKQIDRKTFLPGMFLELLRTLEAQAEIAYGKRGKVITAQDAGYVTGTFRSNARGFGFLIPEEADRRRTGGDLFIPPDATLGAITGDRVIAKMISEPHRRDGRGGEGKILRILERSLQRVIGTLRVEHTTSRRRETIWYVIPDERRYDLAVRIEGELPEDAVPGAKVLAEITAYPHAHVVRSYGRRMHSQYYAPGLLHVRGKLLRIFGDAASVEANYQAILEENGIPSAFPEAVTAEAERAAAKPLLSENREDLRDRMILTIDGADARDLDDAISVERRGDGWLLGVHIADVSAYVRPGTALDAEAFARGTSVYFPDRVIPMLPQALSNGSCSLNAGVDRYALTAWITLDREGNILSCTPSETLICSKLRGVYSELNDVIDRGEASVFFEKYKILGEMLPDMLSLYEILEKKSRASGALSFETAESMILVEDGIPTKIERRTRGTAERFIEQFMLCANRAVAEWLYWQDLPCVYRVHEEPAPEKLQAFAVFAHNLGLDVTPLRAKKIFPAALTRVLDAANEKGLSETVSLVMLRSLAKAKYSATPAPHFGLAIDKYCHFTSPIRRYPDLAVHRMVKATLHGDMTKQIGQMQRFAENAAAKSSANELRALTAERAVDDLFRVLYLQQHIGELFDGVISMVGSYGFFVTLENSCEGLVPMGSLDDGFVFHEPSLTVSHSGMVFMPGKRVRVCVEQCDIPTRRATFALAE